VSELQRPAAMRPPATGIWHFPPRAFVIALVTRALIIWAGMRVLLALGIALLDAGPPFRLPASTAFVLALVAATLGWIEVRRRREHLLLGNLGVGQAALFLIGLVPAAILESLLLLVWHVPA
jgi:hypothetical protein